MIKKIILGALISTSAFALNQAEINLNNNDVEGQVRLDLSNGTYVGARILNGDERNSDRIWSIDPLMEVSFMVMRPVEAVPGLSLGLGIKAEYTKFDGHRYATIPLGLEAEMKLPVTTPFPLYVGGALYFAPSILAFHDGEGYLERRIHLDVEPIHNGRIEVGYRNIDTDLKNRDVTYNDAWYFGLRLDF